jgi:predicted hydrocarbon binding protein
MQIKDNLYSWLVQNIFIPKMEILDNPGFIVSHFTEKGKKVYLREMFFPEQVIIDLENLIVQKYGKGGRQALYSAGKKFGYRYAQASLFPKKSASTKSDFLKFWYNFIRFAESMYASRMQHEIDWEKNLLTVKIDDYMVCSKNGIGEMLTSGSVAGIWAYCLDNPDSEGIETECQGKGAKSCTLLCGPDIKCEFRENGLTGLGIEKEYETINAIKPAKFSKNSCKTLLDSKFLNYSKGIVSFKGDRFVLNESGAYYLTEIEISKLDGGEQLLFDAAFDFSKKIGQREKDTKFIIDFLPALGWGDSYVKEENGKYSVYTLFFPWMGVETQISFAWYRGMLSGLLSGMKGRDMRLTKIQKSFEGATYVLKMSEA